MFMFRDIIQFSKFCFFSKTVTALLMSISHDVCHDLSFSH